MTSTLAYYASVIKDDTGPARGPQGQARVSAQHRSPVEPTQTRGG